MNNLSHSLPSFNFVYDHSEDLRRTGTLINDIEDRLSRIQLYKTIYIEKGQKIEKLREKYICLINNKSKNYKQLDQLKSKIELINESLLTLTDYKIFLINKIEENILCHIQELDKSIEMIKNLKVDHKSNNRNHKCIIPEKNVEERTKKFSSNSLKVDFNLI